ncbi:hypothetical protein D9758_005298 [Tetrapyrgos nigripes]|uniref:CCHC-type domain-containing protein n=1 Tax=Tetrapyrgos nigripes TaxID=182062 RepID=A0A8H5GX03_9AGAR|nr:hypothetical protein D9758_005298 [Tetrapyrgos nigripes]
MFTAKPTLYETENSRVTFASSYLTGAAARYYQNLIEREVMEGVYLVALHNWQAFVGTFGRLFGVHDEQLYSQAALDKVLQRADENFADFLVRFEDASLLTQYNEPVLRWRLLLQIRRDLRNRLTLVGRIPRGFNDVVDRLLDLDTAREAFNEAGLATNNYANPTYVPNVAPVARARNNQQNAVVVPGPITQANRNRPRANQNQNLVTGRTAQPQPLGNRPFVRLTREERDRRMKNGLCIRCGASGHFGRDCPPENDPAPAEEAIARAGIIIEEGEVETYYGYDEEGNIHELDREEEEQGNEERAQDELPEMD